MITVKLTVTVSLIVVLLFRVVTAGGLLKVSWFLPSHDGPVWRCRHNFSVVLHESLIADSLLQELGSVCRLNHKVLVVVGASSETRSCSAYLLLSQILLKVSALH
jgi:hypothetical protein